MDVGTPTWMKRTTVVILWWYLQLLPTFKSVTFCMIWEMG